MKRLVGFAISSIMIFFVLWCAMAYAQYGNDIIDMHLDLGTMFENLTTQISLIDWDSVYRNFRQGIDTVLETTNNGVFGNIRDLMFPTLQGLSWNLFVSVIETLFNPIIGAIASIQLLGYLLIALWYFVVAVFSLGMVFTDFVFNPLFIY